jgi:hypothetical protein
MVLPLPVEKERSSPIAKSARGGGMNAYGHTSRVDGENALGQLNGARTYCRKERSSPIAKSSRGGMKVYGHMSRVDGSHNRAMSVARGSSTAWVDRCGRAERPRERHKYDNVVATNMPSVSVTTS